MSKKYQTFFVRAKSPALRYRIDIERLSLDLDKMLEHIDSIGMSVVTITPIISSDIIRSPEGTVSFTDGFIVVAQSIQGESHE